MVNNQLYRLKQAGIIVSLFCFTLFSSCSGESKVVAKVDDHELLESDAAIIMEHLGYDINNKKDWQRFIQTWVENETLRLELEKEHPEKSILVEMRSQLYAGELAKYYLIEEKITQELDTVISEKELHNYFDQHQEEFALQDYLVQALYIKIPTDKDAENKIKEHYLLKNDKDLSKVNSYAKLYAENFYFDDQQWIYFSDLTKDIPLNKFNKDNIVLNRTKTYFTEGDFTYFINIIDYKLKNSSPPFEFLKQQIREIIVSQRINKLKEANEAKLVQQTKNKHEIKINL